MTEPVVAPSLEEIRGAAAGLAPVILRTPLVPLRDEHQQIWLKLETLQPVGSFKIRGVYHAVSRLAPDARARGVSTVSAGNTAQALAWAARRFGVRARSVMPEDAPSTKIDAVRELGATPDLRPRAEVFRYLRERLWQTEPEAFVHPWTDRSVLVGHASMGLEIAADLPDIDTVFVPVGGGGLLGGVGSALRALLPAARIVAVEPAECPALHESVRLGRPAEVACSTLCDGVAVPYITEEMFPLLSTLADEVLLVTEDDVRAAVRRLALVEKLVVEPSGALALAAALRLDAADRGKSVCLVTGGSIDRDKLAAILAG